MMNPRTLAVCAFGIVLSAHGLHGQSASQYRNFALKSNLASVSTLSGVAASEAKVVHQRPAVLKDLEWRPSRWVSGTTSASTDPVEQILFSFYNDQLFRVVVDYGHERTEGMTNADMISAISTEYGTPLKKAPVTALRSTLSRVEIESGSQIAKWGDAGHTVVLYRSSSYREAFRLIVSEPVLDDLARKATVQSVRLDDQEAPSRELARQKKERDEALANAEKARVANKGGFRP